MLTTISKDESDATTTYATYERWNPKTDTANKKKTSSLNKFTHDRTAHMHGKHKMAVRDYDKKLTISILGGDMNGGYPK